MPAICYVIFEASETIIFFIFFLQDMTNSGLWYLCQAAAGGNKDGLNAKTFQVKYS